MATPHSLREKKRAGWKIAVGWKPPPPRAAFSRAELCMTALCRVVAAAADDAKVTVGRERSVGISIVMTVLGTISTLTVINQHSHSSSLFPQNCFPFRPEESRLHEEEIDIFRQQQQQQPETGGDINK